MKITETTATKLIIDGVEDLDPVAVYLEDLGPERGKVTITCFDDCWTYFWGAMGKGNSIRSFFLGCDVDYLARKFAPRLDATETDLSEIVEHTRKEILKRRRLDELSKEDTRKYWDEAEGLNAAEDSRWLFDHHSDIMHDVFGDEWYFCLPKIPNYKYEHLCKIIKTVQGALQTFWVIYEL